LLLERSFTELGASWLQKKNAKSLRPLHIMVAHPSENRFVSLRWVLLDWQLQCPRWLEKCLKYFDVIGFVRIQWLTLDGVGVGVVTQCRKSIVCIASVCHGKVQHYHTGLLREIAFYIQEEPLA